MQIQNETGIYVYSVTTVYSTNFADPGGSKKVVHYYYETIEDFFRAYSIGSIKSLVGYHISDTVCQEIVSQTRHRNHWGRFWYSNQKYCNTINCKHHGRGTNAHVVCDENGNIFTPDRLVGLYRKWFYTKPKRKCRWTHAGYKSSVYGGHRTLHTFQERKWAHAWDDEEFAPKVRRARQGHNLPDSWDDYNRHAEKCWKFQSKRTHQWNPK